MLATLKHWLRNSIEGASSTGLGFIVLSPCQSLIQSSTGGGFYLVNICNNIIYNHVSLKWLKEFLQKPFHMKQLVAMVEKYIGQKYITDAPQISRGVN
jgi:hypothetical protein